MDNFDALDPEGFDVTFEGRDWDDTAARYGEAEASSDQFACWLEEQRFRRTIHAAEELATLTGSGSGWSRRPARRGPNRTLSTGAPSGPRSRRCFRSTSGPRSPCSSSRDCCGTASSARSRRSAPGNCRSGTRGSSSRRARASPRSRSPSTRIGCCRSPCSWCRRGWRNSRARFGHRWRPRRWQSGTAKRSLHQPGETRTLAQIKADVFRDLFLDGMGVRATVEGGEPVATASAQRGARPEVYVHVPVLTAMGKTEEPGELEGYGPIDPETARELAGAASGWIRLLTDPETATVLSFGQKVYKVPAALRRYLVVRDEVCRFVGCTRAAKYCDVDHTVPWIEDGETIAANLAHLCRGHHRLKGSARWRVAQHPGGVGILTWTSPTGRRYSSQPAVKLPPPRKRGPVLTKLLAQAAWAEDPSSASTPPF